MSDSEDDLFAGAPTFKSKIRTEQAKQTRSINYLDKVLEKTLEKREQRERIESLMKKNDEFAVEKSLGERLSPQLHDSDAQEVTERRPQFDDSSEEYWNKIESMALNADKTVHERDKRRRDLEDLIDGYNGKSDAFLEEDSSFPSERREKRQALIHAKQVGTSSNVGTRRIFGNAIQIDQHERDGIFVPYECIRDAISDLNEIINFDTSSLDKTTKENFENFRKHILVPIQRNMALNTLTEVLRGTVRTWILDIPYAAEFREWLIRVGISGQILDANLSISSFEYARSLLLQDVPVFHLSIPRLSHWSEAELSLSELERIFSNDFGVYMSDTTTHKADDAQETNGSTENALMIVHTLRLWDLFIKKGLVLDEGFLISDHVQDCTALKIIRDLLIAFVDPLLYQNTYNFKVNSACTDLIGTIFDHITMHYKWTTMDSLFSYTTADTEKVTECWQHVLSTMIIQKVSTLSSPCLPLAQIVRSLPFKERSNALFLNFAPHLFFGCLSYCYGKEVAKTLESKIQKTCLSFVQDINTDFDIDDITLRYEMVAMGEVGLRELLRYDELKHDSETFLAIVDISYQCVALGKYMFHLNISNYSMKSKVGEIYQSTSEAAAMFHFYSRLFDLCTSLKRSITSVISDSNLRRVKELLNSLLTYYGEEKRNASLLAKLSNSRQSRQSSLMSYIQRPSLEMEQRDTDDGYQSSEVNSDTNN